MKDENTLKIWLANASTEETKKLAAMAGTSVSYLRHVAAGRRQLSVELASRIERASLILRTDRVTLPDLTRGALCDVCRKCPYYNRTR